MKTILICLAAIALTSCERHPMAPIEIRFEGSRTIVANCGIEVGIVLGTVGPGHYASPPAITGPSAVFVKEEPWGIANPGGPTQRFIFRTVSTGTSIVRIMHTDNGSVVEDTVVVR
jgi:hypothetical protein